MKRGAPDSEGGGGESGGEGDGAPDSKRTRISEAEVRSLHAHIASQDAAMAAMTEELAAKDEQIVELAAQAATHQALTRVGEQPPATDQLHRSPPGEAQGTEAEATKRHRCDRAAAIVNGLQCGGLGGWERIFSFTEPKGRTRASAACVAFFTPTNNVKRSATFGRKQLIVDGAPTLERLLRARERFPELCVRAINLQWCGMITDGFIAVLIGICPEVTDVNLEGCFRITDASIVALAKRCPLLKKVNLSNCELITDVSVGSLAECCPQLKNVNLAYCKRLTDASVGSLAECRPQLENVNLAYCKRLTDASIVALAKRCPLLKKVNLEGCFRITGVSVGLLAECCPQLKSLKFPRLNSVDGCFAIDGTTFTGESGLTDAIVAQVMMRPEAAELTEIDFVDCELITDVSIVAVVRSCTCLMSVDGYFTINEATLTGPGGSELTDAIVVEVMLRPEAAELTEVDLVGCVLITDASAVAVAASCPQLKRVNLGGCELITDASIVVLMEKCSQLKIAFGYFTIDEVGFRRLFIGEPGLTDAIVAQVMLRPEAAELTEIDFVDCVLITDASIEAVAASCPRLTDVCLRGCELVTDVSVVALVRSCPLCAVAVLPAST